MVYIVKYLTRLKQSLMHHKKQITCKKMYVQFVVWIVCSVSHGYSLGPTGDIGTHGHGSNTTSITRPLWNTPKVEMLTDKKKSIGTAKVAIHRIVHRLRRNKLYDSREDNNLKLKNVPSFHTSHFFEVFYNKSLQNKSYDKREQKNSSRTLLTFIPSNDTKLNIPHNDSNLHDKWLPLITFNALSSIPASYTRTQQQTSVFTTNGKISMSMNPKYSTGSSQTQLFVSGEYSSGLNRRASFSEEFGGTMDVVTLSSNMIFVIFAIALNFSVSSFYRRQIKKLIPFIYFSVSITDLITALSCLSHPLILVLLLFTKQDRLCSVLILVFYSINSTSIRAGVFLNLVLSVVRSINIVRPFYQVRIKWIKSACLVYPILWCLVVGYDVFWVLSLGYMHYPKALFKYMIYMPMVGSGTAARLLGDDPSYMETIFFGMTVPFIFPSVLVLICFMFQVYYLSASKVEMRRSHKIVLRRPAITIFQLTLLFLICNLSATAVYIYFFLPSGTEQRRTGAHDARLMYISSCVLHVVNAAFSPAIMILRGRSLKNAIKLEIISIRSGLSSKSLSSGRRFTGVKAVVHRY